MPEPTDPQATPQGDPAPSPTPPTNPTPTDPTPTPAGDPQEPADLDGLKKALASERTARAEAARDAKAKAKELADAQAKLKEHEDAQKSELDKALETAKAAEERAQAAEERARETALRFEVVRVAGAKNFADPEDPYRMLDWSKATFSDDGKPEGVEPLIEQLAKDKPYLLKAPTVRPPAPTPTGNRDQRGAPADEKERQAAMAQQVRQLV